MPHELDPYDRNDIQASLMKKFERGEVKRKEKIDESKLFVPSSGRADLGSKIIDGLFGIKGE